MRLIGMGIFCALPRLLKHPVPVHRGEAKMRAHSPALPRLVVLTHFVLYVSGASVSLQWHAATPSSRPVVARQHAAASLARPPTLVAPLSDLAIDKRGLSDVANMFVEAWFSDSISSDAQHAQLVEEIDADMCRRYATLRRADRSRLIVAHGDDGKVIGCAGLELLPFTADGQTPRGWRQRMSSTLRPHISNLAVARDARRTGVATHLVRTAEEVAREWGYDEQTLFVEHSNEPAIGLYERLGYRAVAYLRAEKPLPRPGQQQRVQPGFALQWRRTTNAFLVRDLSEPAPAGTFRA